VHFLIFVVTLRSPLVMLDLFLRCVVSLRAGLVFPLLQQPEPLIQALAAQQFLVGAALDDAPAVRHENGVGTDDGGQPVCDDESGSILRKAVEFQLDRML